MKNCLHFLAILIWCTAAALPPLAVYLLGGWPALAALIVSVLVAVLLLWLGVSLYTHGDYIGLVGEK
jgi:Tfp pilus assembly protein PilO